MRLVFLALSLPLVCRIAQRLEHLHLDKQEFRCEVSEQLTVLEIFQITEFSVLCDDLAFHRNLKDSGLLFAEQEDCVSISNGQL